jgi:hypothetical protein
MSFFFGVESHFDPAHDGFSLGNDVVVSFNGIINPLQLCNKFTSIYLQYTFYLQYTYLHMKREVR